MEERFHRKVPNRTPATLRRKTYLARPLGYAHKGLYYKLAHKGVYYKLAHKGIEIEVAMLRRR